MTVSITLFVSGNSGISSSRCEAGRPILGPTFYHPRFIAFAYGCCGGAMNCSVWSPKDVKALTNDFKMQHYLQKTPCRNIALHTNWVKGYQFKLLFALVDAVVGHRYHQSSSWSSFNFFVILYPQYRWFWQKALHKYKVCHYSWIFWLILVRDPRTIGNLTAVDKSNK